MDTGPNLGLLFALFGVLVGCVGVPILFIVVFVKLRGAKQEIAQNVAAVQAGGAKDLLPWHPGALSELTREWVGTSTYTGGVLGRTDQAGGRVPSSRTPGFLIRFAMQAENDGADGLIRAFTTAHQLELRIANGACQAMINGAPLGTLRLQETAIFNAQQVALGNFRREPPGARLRLNGRDVASLDTRTVSDLKPGMSTTPLVAQLAIERSAEEEAWALVVAVLEVAWFGPRNQRGGN